MTNVPKKPADAIFTDEQWQAIHADDKDILVSASAGSGKTRVLVERVLEKIKAGVNVDELLVVTFTRAAAKEMKDRIETELHQAINIAAPNDKAHLIKQLSLLPRANISTIHAFCLEVIRRFYYVIETDPVFRLVTDDTEIGMMKDTVWDNLSEELLGKDESFRQLTLMFSEKFDDDLLKNMIFSLYATAIAKPNTIEWLENLGSLYNLDEESFYQSVLYQDYLLSYTHNVLADVVARYEELDEAVALNPNAGENVDIVQDELERFIQLKEMLSQLSYDDIRQKILGMSFERWKTAKGLEKEEKAELNELKDMRNDIKNYFRKLKDHYLFPLAEELSHSQEMFASVQAIAKTTIAFNAAYTDYKQDRQILDFSDLEHMAHQILTTKVNEQFEARNFYQDYFEEIMIDEYQDTNPLQEAILTLISRQATDKSNNRFMVGDVKQSIYAFRQADPGMFIEKFNHYQLDNESGERIILQENFRSRKEVLDFTNLIFQQLMDNRLGEVSYDKQAELINGFTAFPKEEGMQPEILVYERKTELSEPATPESVPYNLQFTRESFIGQAVTLALRIRAMVADKMPIYDKELKTTRPVSYEDIVILNRVSKNNLKLQQVFQALQIPINLESTQNYFQTLEVSIMMDVLRLIDNPHQDLPLAAVLRSPIVGLNEDEMARVRIADPEGDYYDALCAFIQKNAKSSSKTFEKLSLFIAEGCFASWRKLSKRVPIAELIWQIYADTGFLDYVGGMPNGKQRKANLHALYEHATAFEETEYKGIFQFIRYIERMVKDNHDLEEPAALADSEQAVRVMTIHGSKGLEFPVVCLLDLTKSFNQKDAEGDFTFDDDLGVGLRYINKQENYKTSTIQDRAVKYAKEVKSKSEEMRILYVALTRAEQKLIIVGAYDSKDKAYDKWATTEATQSLVLPEATRLKANSLLDWIGMSIYRHPDAHVQDRQVGYNADIQQSKSHFQLNFVNADALYKQVMPLLSEENQADWFKAFNKDNFNYKIATEEEIALSSARDLLNLHYPYVTETQTSSFQSVSEIKRIFEDPNQSNLVLLDSNLPRGRNRYVTDSFERPNFIAEKAVDSAAVGSGTHALLQNLNFNQDVDLEKISQTLQRLVIDGVIQKNVADKINVQAIATFFTSSLGQDILQHASSLVREASFSLKYPAAKIFKGLTSEDDILIHGVVDGYYIDQGEIVLFDYKTDDIAHLGLNYERIILERYQGQLNLYAIALENILDLPIKAKYIVLLANQDVITVPIMGK